MAYVPPHMRKNGASKEQTPSFKPEKDQPTLYTIEEIQHHYWRYAQKKDKDQDTDLPKHSTLNDSAESQGLLSHVMLFHGANPRWESDGIIFVKSNLEILPQYQQAKAEHDHQQPQAELPQACVSEKQTTFEDKRNAGTGTPDPKQLFIDVAPVDITPKDRRLIACFEQGRRSMAFDGFKFAGYRTIENIALLAPHSRALTRMLEQKWSLTNKQGGSKFAKRRPEDWDKSFGYEWAVIKFAKPEGGDVPPPPEIERLPLRERKAFTPQKSVNEMITEIRLDENADGTKHDPIRSEGRRAD